MVSLYIILGAFARRWYGGMFPDEEYKILGNRGLQTAFMCLLFLSIYLPSSNNWLVPMIITAWLQFQFWSRGHGCCFDMGTDENPTEKTIDRYKERWYYEACNWLADKLGFEQYSRKYDFCYMTLRYACPMIPMMYFDWRYILVGLAISPIYEFCWWLYQKRDWCFEEEEIIDSATKMAELICGAIVYGGCYLLC